MARKLKAVYGAGLQVRVLCLDLVDFVSQTAGGAAYAPRVIIF